jgi:hypothetical protein
VAAKTVKTTTTGAVGGYRPPAHVQRPAAFNGRPAARDERFVQDHQGNDIRMRPDGHPGDVYLKGANANVHYYLGGGRRIEVVRGDRSRVYVGRRGGGYIAHPYMFHGREFEHRTFVENGRVYDRFYGVYEVRPGYYVNYYRPVYYYAPAFYGWAYNPWPVPVHYGWGWSADPWFGYYGYYFTPAPAYLTTSLWLTDYLVAADLAAAYQANAVAQQAALPSAPDAAPMTPEVRQQIADEVQRQIQLEYNEVKAGVNADPDPAKSSIQHMFSDGVQHVFVASSNVDVVDAGGSECSISEGDALQLSGVPDAQSTVADLIVLSAKGGKECRKGATVTVAIADLQEMQNHMRETVDQGLADLQTKQSTGGLPAIPPTANAAPQQTELAANAPGPDKDVAKELRNESAAVDQEAGRAANDASQSLAPGPNASLEAKNAEPPKVDVGQAIDAIVQVLGTPTSVFNGAAGKQIYLFEGNVKVTVVNGKAVSIQ